LSTNYRPIIRGTDVAIWRRIRLIPFTVTFPPDKQDKDLSKKLREELSGILAWAVRGCLEWQRDGLGIPDEVSEATSAYKSEMDVVSRFIDDRCVKQPNLEVKAGALYESFVKWAEQNGEPTMSQRAFGQRLDTMGFEKAHDRKGTRRFGLALLETTL